MKDVLLALVRFLAHLFYRDVEVAGLSNIPREGPVFLVANHQNGLVDPMLVLATLPRDVVFVAKSTLWRIPLLRSVLDLFGVVPVVRRADVAKEGEPGGQDRNDQSFQRLAGVLRSGGAVLLFPEGRSHSDPALSPMRTGAARILLLADVPAAIVPLGFWFQKKEEFRSDVLMSYGAPVVPAERSVDGITEAIREGLEAVTLNASSWDEHAAVRAVEFLYGEKLPLEGGEGLARHFRSRKVLLEARPALEAREPGAVDALIQRARVLERLLLREGLAPKDLDGAPPLARVVREAASSVAVLALGLPLALIGLLAFFVPYQLVGIVVKRLLTKEQLDQISLYKILVGLVLHVAAWAAIVGGLFLWIGALPAVGAAVLLPLAGYVALVVSERFQRDRGRLRAFLTLVFSRDRLGLLRKERDDLVAECERLAARLPPA
ncbi:MAG: 1-acyl-sn-glycerol-3-phosphate acyltransferase [Acidobacteria bacterium]|nr:1-acyl-sn-glycerol-3-phosphate acyltransferase [Acidobacteriota bacterium]